MLRLDLLGREYLSQFALAFYCRTGAKILQFELLADLDLAFPAFTPVVSLNRAVAVAVVAGLRSGLALVDELVADNHFENYHLLHAARADLLRRLGFPAEAAESYQRAVALVTNDSERRFLERRLREVQSPQGSGT